MDIQSDLSFPGHDAPVVAANQVDHGHDSVDVHRESKTCSGIHHDLIRAACAAPSADNNQPWKFKPTDRGLEVYCDLQRRLPSDVDGMFDLLSLGTAIENISLALSTIGRKADISLVDPSIVKDESGEDGNLRFLASISFGDAQSDSVGDELSKYIAARHTTRTPFSLDTIESEQLEEITSVAIRDDHVQLRWEQDRAKIKQIGSLVAMSDSLRFRYRDFHEELHRQLRLTPGHAEQTRDGLDYRTLGLPLGGSWMLRALRPWRTMEFLNRFGAASLLAAPSARLVRCSGAIGFIYVNDRSMQSMIEGGRTMQRMWLQATRLGFAVHPLGSLPIFLANESLPPELVRVADRVREKAGQLLPTTDGFLQMAFRIGKARTETRVRSMRRSWEEVTLATDPTTKTPKQ